MTYSDNIKLTDDYWSVRAFLIDYKIRKLLGYLSDDFPKMGPALNGFFCCPFLKELHKFN